MQNHTVPIIKKTTRSFNSCAIYQSTYLFNSYSSAVKYFTVSKLIRLSVHLSCQSLSDFAICLRNFLLHRVRRIVKTTYANTKKNTATAREKQSKYVAKMMVTIMHSKAAGTNMRKQYFIKLSQAAMPRSILLITSPSFLIKCQSKLRLCRCLKLSSLSWTNAACATLR